VSATLTYVYCLVRSTRPPSVRDVPAPVSGGRAVRLLEVPPAPRADGRFRQWLVVSSVPAREYDEAALGRNLKSEDWVIPRALAHEAVVEHFLPLPAVLPMQLFTLFTGDERAVEHMVRDRRRIARILRRIEGRLEWGLRITVSRPVRGPEPRTPRHRGLTPGAAYLARKRELREAGRTALARARGDAGRVYTSVARAAAAARRRTEVERAAPDSRVVLDAAFLVPVAHRRAFQALVRRHTRPLRQAGMTVSLTGPWPAYNFI